MFPGTRRYCILSSVSAGNLAHAPGYSGPFFEMFQASVFARILALSITSMLTPGHDCTVLCEVILGLGFMFRHSFFRDARGFSASGRNLGRAHNQVILRARSKITGLLWYRYGKHPSFWSSYVFFPSITEVPPMQRFSPNQGGK